MDKQQEKYLDKNKKNFIRLIKFKFGSLKQMNVKNLSAYNFDEKGLVALSYEITFHFKIKILTKLRLI